MKLYLSKFYSLIPAILFSILFASPAVDAQTCRSLYSAVSASANAQRSTVIAAPRITENSIISNSPLTKIIRGFFNLVDSRSTTGLRQETKFVLDEPILNGFLDQLRSENGETFQLRDQVKPGMKNVTMTDYAFPLEFRMPPAQKFLAAKLRFRKYFEADTSRAMSLDQLIPSESTKSVSWVELKTDHPEHLNVVIKPRILMHDSDAKLVRNARSYRQFRHKILQRTLELNATADPKVVDQFFQLFDALPERTPLLATTAYVRESYVLALKDTQGKKVDIQITVDREVKVNDQRTGGAAVTAYGANEVVVELKVPLAYSKLSQENFNQVPGLDKIAAFKALLEQAHIPSFSGGKLATFQRRLRQQALQLIGD